MSRETGFKIKETKERRKRLEARISLKEFHVRHSGIAKEAKDIKEAYGVDFENKITTFYRNNDEVKDGSILKNMQKLEAILSAYGFNHDEVSGYIYRNPQQSINAPADLIYRLAIFEKAHLAEEVLFRRKSFIGNSYTQIQLSTPLLYAFAESKGYNFDLDELREFAESKSMDKDKQKIVQKYPFKKEAKQNMTDSLNNHLSFIKQKAIGEEISFLRKRYDINGLTPEIVRFYEENPNIRSLSILDNVKNLEALLEAYGYSEEEISDYLNSNSDPVVANSTDVALRLAIFEKAHLLEETLFYARFFLGMDYTKNGVSTRELYALARKNDFNLTLDELVAFEYLSEEYKEALVNEFPLGTAEMDYLYSSIREYVNMLKSFTGNNKLELTEKGNK